LVTAGVDASDSVPLISSPSITKFLTLASHDSTTQSLKATSSRRSQDSVSSRPDSPILRGLEALALPSFCFEDLPTDVPITGVSEDMKTKTASAQSAPSSPVLSKTSCSPHSQDAEKPQTSSPSLLSKRSLSPVSPPQLTSKARIELSPKALPAEPQPEPLEVTAKEKLSVQDLSPLLLFPNVSDTCLASPTTPTLSPSLCYSPSDVSEITPIIDNGDLITSRITDITTIKGRRADITPFADKKCEGGIIQEVIVEGPEPFPDEDDLDPFASPSSPLPTTVITPPARYGIASASIGCTSHSPVFYFYLANQRPAQPGLRHLAHPPLRGLRNHRRWLACAANLRIPCSGVLALARRCHTWPPRIHRHLPHHWMYEFITVRPSMRRHRESTTMRFVG